MTNQRAYEIFGEGSNQDTVSSAKLLVARLGGVTAAQKIVEARQRIGKPLTQNEIFILHKAMIYLEETIMPFN